MRKRTVIGLCIGVFLLFLSQHGFAQNPEDKVGLGLNVSYMSIADDEDAEYDTAVLIGANLTYVFTKAFSVEISAGYSKTDIDYDLGGNSINIGEFTSYPILLIGRFHFPIGKTVSPYIGGGAGYFVNSFDLNQSNFIAGVNMDAENSVAFHINGGIEFFYSSNLALSLDVKYIWNEAEFRSTGVMPFEGDADLNTLLLGTGFKYYF